MTAQSVYREELIANAQAATYCSQSLAQATGWTQWMVASKVSGQKVLGFLCEMATTLTATGSEAVTASTSVLDEGLDQLQVSADPTQDPRIYLTSSRAASELMRLTLDNANFSYPVGGAPAAFSASGSRVDNCYLVVPAGGDVAAIRIHVPSITNVFAAKVTASTVWTIRTIYGSADTLVVAKETNSSAVSGKQDIVSLSLVPADISPTYVDFLNTYEAGNADGVTQAQAYGPDGELLIDVDTPYAVQQLQGFFPDQTAPNVEYGTNLYQTVFGLKGKRPKKFTMTFGTSYTPDVLWIQYTAGAAVAPTPTPSPTPVPPAVNETQATSPVARVAAGLGYGPRRMQ